MPKRKASDDRPSIPQTRLNTRSAKLLGDYQPPLSSPRKRVHLPKKVQPQVKENQEVIDPDDADVLNLYHDSDPGARTTLDSVEIATPTRRRGRRSERVTRDDFDNEDPMLLSPSKKHKSNFSSPSKTTVETGTPLKGSQKDEPSSSPQRLPRILPPHLHSCLTAQKRAIIAALQHPEDYEVNNEDDGADKQPYANTASFQELSSLLAGTVSRSEGNSCLVLGPRNSGKSRVSPNFTCLLYHTYMAPKLVNQAIDTLPDNPIIVRLSGWAQHNDRLAMREIARQLSEQTGGSFMKVDDMVIDEDENPFQDADPSILLPPPSHLPGLISVLPTLSRPTIVVLDAFDMFALHARQSLLYCLLDTVQSCRAGNGSKGVAVIGITTRIDTVNLLEKRVKSRFSGRMLRTAGPRKSINWLAITRKILSSPIISEHQAEWNGLWSSAVERFVCDPKVVQSLNEMVSLLRDVTVIPRLLVRINHALFPEYHILKYYQTQPILTLSPSSPFPVPSVFIQAVNTQRYRPRFHFLDGRFPPINAMLPAT